MSTASVVLAVDVGGTSFKGALVDESGRIVAEEVAAVAGAMGEEAFARFEGLCESLVARAASQGLQTVAAGIITPGMDDVTGRVLFSSNLGWRDLRLRDRLAAKLGLPVAPGHDVRTAGLAEALLGAGRGARDVAVVMIGTGIAAALVTNGTVVSGARSMAGEFGHAPVTNGGELCLCGQHGCLEAYASAAAIARRYALAGGGQALSAADIASAQDEDPVARQVWAEAVDALAVGLTTLTMLLDPDRFVIGGGLAEAGPVLLEPLAAALAKRLAWRTAPPLVRSTLGGAAGKLGAAILAFRAVGRGDVVGDWTA